MVFEKLFCQEKSEENYLQMLPGHTDDVSAVTLELMGAFVYSFTASSTESWRLQQWEQTEKEDPLLVYEYGHSLIWEKALLQINTIYIVSYG